MRKEKGSKHRLKGTWFLSNARQNPYTDPHMQVCIHTHTHPWRWVELAASWGNPFINVLHRLLSYHNAWFLFYLYQIEICSIFLLHSQRFKWHAHIAANVISQSWAMETFIQIHLFYRESISICYACGQAPSENWTAAGPLRSTLHMWTRHHSWGCHQQPFTDIQLSHSQECLSHPINHCKCPPCELLIHNILLF